MMNDDGPKMTDAPADPNSSTMMNDNGTMMPYNSTMMAQTTRTYPPYVGPNLTNPDPPPMDYYAANPIHAYAIFTEAIDSNYTQQKNESLGVYNDTNLGFFPTDAPAGLAGQQKEWIPITGIE